MSSTDPGWEAEAVWLVADGTKTAAPSVASEALNKARQSRERADLHLQCSNISLSDFISWAHRRLGQISRRFQLRRRRVVVAVRPCRCGHGGPEKKGRQDGEERMRRVKLRTPARPVARRARYLLPRPCRLQLQSCVFHASMGVREMMARALPHQRTVARAAACGPAQGRPRPRRDVIPYLFPFFFFARGHSIPSCVCVAQNTVMCTDTVCRFDNVGKLSQRALRLDRY